MPCEPPSLLLPTFWGTLKKGNTWWDQTIPTLNNQQSGLDLDNGKPLMLWNKRGLRSECYFKAVNVTAMCKVDQNSEKLETERLAKRPNQTDLSCIPTTLRPTWQLPDKYLREKNMLRKSPCLNYSISSRKTFAKVISSSSFKCQTGCVSDQSCLEE